MAQRLVEDVTRPERGVLTEREAHVDASMYPLLQDLLLEEGWHADEPWTPLRRDLTEPTEHPDIRVEVIGPEQAPEIRGHYRTA